jgi:hypothetical protein
MANLLRDLAVLMFAASEEIEKKSTEFRQKREERFKKFSAEMKVSKEAFVKKHEKELARAHDKISAEAGKIGIATRSEIDDLKTMVAELSGKLDKVLKEKK